jgi:hypothetical protein
MGKMFKWVDDRMISQNLVGRCLEFLVCAIRFNLQEILFSNTSYGRFHMHLELILIFQATD